MFRFDSFEVAFAKEEVEGEDFLGVDPLPDQV